MSDPFNLVRFIEAQDPVYARVCSELRQGRKVSHWMWFVFPQIEGLGRSGMAQQFAISSLEEARAYLRHPVLGPRLRECTRLVCQISETTIQEIFGSPDDMKVRSCMTLFSQGDVDDGIFQEALNKFFSGEPDELTLERIRG
jgi:uncharacterized protein (DUF1810 family)